MLQDFRKHTLNANDVFRIKIKTESFFCKLMAEEVFVFFNTKDGISLKKLVDLRMLEKFSKTNAVLFEVLSLENDFDENRDFATIKATFNNVTNF